MNTRDDYAYQKETSGDWSHNEADAFQKAAAEANQGYSYGYSGPTTKDPEIQHQLFLTSIDRNLFPSLEPYTGKKSWPKWARSFDEVVTKFFARNVFFMGPGDYVMTMEGIIIPMSESGVRFSNTDQKIDFVFNMAVAGLGVFKLAKISNALKVVNGNVVIQDNTIINPDRVDARGNTNLERMKKGLAPIEPDGKPVNLHHVNQTMNGPLEEMTSTYHQQNYSKLHLNKRQLPSEIDRKVFDQFRYDYWQLRSDDF